MSDTDSYRSMAAIFLQDRQVSSRRSNDRRIADQASSPAAPRSTGSGPTKGPVVLIQTPTGAGTLRAPNPPEVTKDPSVDEDIDSLDGFFPPGLFADVVDSSGALRYGREYVYGVGAAVSRIRMMAEASTDSYRVEGSLTTRSHAEVLPGQRITL